MSRLLCKEFVQALNLALSWLAVRVGTFWVSIICRGCIESLCSGSKGLHCLILNLVFFYDYTFHHRAVSYRFGFGFCIVPSTNRTGCACCGGVLFFLQIYHFPFYCHINRASFSENSLIFLAGLFFA